MRVLGMVAAVFVLAAAVLGVLSLRQYFGFEAGEIFGILWPVAVGVAAFCGVVLALGRWATKALTRRDR